MDKAAPVNADAVDSPGANPGASSERRFAYSLLEKLIQYLDVAAFNMKHLRPSGNYSRRMSFKTSTRDVKFFSKVPFNPFQSCFNPVSILFRSYFDPISILFQSVYIQLPGCTAAHGEIFQHAPPVLHHGGHGNKQRRSCVAQRKRNGCEVSSSWKSVSLLMRLHRFLFTY